MKNINYITILFLNVIILLILAKIYSSTNKDLTEAKEEYINIKQSSIEYTNLKNSFFLNLDVETKNVVCLDTNENTV